jgi:drug/metabolite transporter (DMT)-like permease
MNLSRSQKGYLLLIAMSLFWGLSWPVMKIALMEIPPWTFRTLSLVSAGVGILMISKIGGLNLSIPRRQVVPLLIVALFNVTGWHLGSAHGISRMASGQAVMLGFTMPLWAAILSTIVLKEKITARKILGLILGLSGLFILIMPHMASVGSAPLGVVFMLGAAMSWGLGTVLVKYFKWSIPILVLTGWQLTFGSLPVVIGMITFDPVPALSELSLNAILAMVYIIALPMLFCHWAWFTVVDIFPASVAAISTLAIPVIGVASSAVFLGERFGVRQFIALTLICSALAIVLLWRNNSVEAQDAKIITAK